LPTPLVTLQAAPLQLSLTATTHPNHTGMAFNGVANASASQMSLEYMSEEQKQAWIINQMSPQQQVAQLKEAMLYMRGGDADKKKAAMDVLTLIQKSVSPPRPSLLIYPPQYLYLLL
jgi:hypothetical protein